MATKPRHQKTETQLWVYDNAKRLGLTEVDLAKATDVQPGTARSWFSRGKPNADAIPILERLFGRPAPAEDHAPDSDQAAVIAALDRLRESVDAQTRLLETAFAATGAGVEAYASHLQDLLARLVAEHVGNQGEREPQRAGRS